MHGEGQHFGRRAAGGARPLLGVHAAVRVAARDACAPVDGERRRALDEAVLRGDHQRRQAVVVDVVDVEAKASEAPDEDLDGDVVADRGAQEQRRVTCNAAVTG